MMPGPVREILIHSKTGVFRALVFCRAALGVQSGEKVCTAGISQLECDFVKDTAYRPSTEDLNEAFDACGTDGEVHLMTFHGHIERIGADIGRQREEEATENLQKHAEEGVDPATGKIRPDSELAQKLQDQEDTTHTVYPDESTVRELPDMSAWEVLEQYIEKAKKAGVYKERKRRSSRKVISASEEKIIKTAMETVKWRNDHAWYPSLQIRHPWRFETDPHHTVYIAMDGVLVPAQKETRGTELSADLPEKSKFICITNISVETEEGFYAITSQDRNEAMRQLVAFLLENGLINRHLVFFVDGERDLFTKIDENFSFCRHDIYLDWYHLCHKVIELLSLALKNRRIVDPARDPVLYVRGANKGQINYNQTKRVSLSVLFSRIVIAMAWVGNVSEIIDYLHSIPKDYIKSQSAMKALTDYIEHKAPYITCYALRKQLGLCNTSNAVENLNEQLVSRREKAAGMSWSEPGSLAVALIKCADHNHELGKRIRHEQVSPALVPRKPKKQQKEAQQAA